LILPVPEKEKSLNFEKNQGLILFCFLKVVPPERLIFRQPTLFQYLIECQNNRANAST
jgi:hypothetical protein